MRPKYKIVRTIERVITWFFPEETKTIYCITIEEVHKKIKEGDVVYKDINGKYVEYNRYDEAERILHKSINEYNKSTSISGVIMKTTGIGTIESYQRIVDNLKKWRN